MGVLQRVTWLLSGHWRRKRNPGTYYAPISSFVDPSSKVGKYCRIGRRSKMLASTLDDYSYISAGSTLSKAHVGKFCSIGPEVMIGGLGKHPSRWLSSHPAFYSTRMQSGRTYVTTNRFEEIHQTYIGNDVWIGVRAIVLDGIRIGDGAIVAAGAVVTKDVDAYAIVGGIPAKVIGYRFAEDVRASLLALAWWNYPDHILLEIAEHFSAREEWTVNDIDSVRSRIEAICIEDNDVSRA